MRRLRIYSVLLVVFAVLITFSSCQKGFIDTDVPKKVVTEKDGLKVILKESVPEDALELSLDDYKVLINTSMPDLQSRSITGEVEYTISLDDLAAEVIIIREKNEYPLLGDVAKMEEDLEIIRNDFPELTDEEIFVNIETIRSIYQQQERYNLYQALEDYEPETASRDVDYPGGLNSEEFWLLFWNPWQIPGTATAATLAGTYTNQKYPWPPYKQYLDPADGFRHCIWNALIAKNVGGTKAERISWAKTFTDAHEHGSPPNPVYPLDNPMDYHNNNIGRVYYYAAATESWFLIWCTVVSPSDATLIADVSIKSLNSVLFTSTDQLEGLIYSLVHIYPLGW